MVEGVVMRPFLISLEIDDIGIKVGEHKIMGLFGD
jgi:hypothetical protein